MESVLIVSAGDKARQVLLELARLSGLCSSASVTSCSDARRLLLESGFDLIIINTPLPDEFGHDFAVMAAESSGAGVILVVKAEMADEISQKVEDAGVFVVEKPINRQMFFQSVKLVGAARRRLQGLKNENVKLKHKIEEIRMVDRAKCLLIQHQNLTEAQAHRYIEKQAMDRRLSRREIAQSILDTYEE
ncbi:MAG: ANTAR domain-containing protein [Oscillospiraceae bacterium]|nr:ANTAR domain-containing protein [Oscillospiraceae bacterium]